MNLWSYKLPNIKKVAEFEEGERFYICGKYQEAEKIFNRIIAHPDKYGLYYNPALYYVRQIHLNLASGYIHGAFYKKAIHELKKLEGANPHYADIHFQLGNCYAYLNQFDKAISEFEMALYLNPTYHQARIKLALIFAKAYQYNNSVRAYEHVLQYHPEFSDIHFNLGIVHGLNRDYMKGAHELEITRNLNPRYPLLDNALEIIKRGRNGIDETHHALIKEQLRNHLIILLEVGEKYSHQGETPEDFNLWDHLIIVYENVQKIHPDYADIFYYKGLFYERKGEYNNAAESFRHALKLNPDYIKAQIALSLSLYRTGDLQGGAVQLEDVIRKRPDYMDLYSHLACMYSEMGKNDKAMDCFRVALRKNPTHNDSLAGLALLFEETGRFADAIQHWEEYSRLLDKGQWQDNIESHINQLKKYV
ncbi:MAG: tetratricopeptide repeat protein [bacterium]